MVLALGETATVVATGHYSDGTEKEITQDLTWEDWSSGGVIAVSPGQIGAIGQTNGASVYVYLLDPVTGIPLLGQTIQVRVN
jgi:hypothetical protein